MSAKIKKIVLVGNSEKFNKIIHQLYRRAEIVVIPWRTLTKTLKKNDLSSFLDTDLILVCGYDYSSSAYHYYKYIDANVTSPLEVIKAIAALNEIKLNNPAPGTFIESRYLNK